MTGTIRFIYIFFNFLMMISVISLQTTGNTNKVSAAEAIASIKVQNVLEESNQITLNRQIQIQQEKQEELDTVQMIHATRAATQPTQEPVQKMEETKKQEVPAVVDQKQSQKTVEKAKNSSAINNNVKKVTEGAAKQVTGEVFSFEFTAYTNSAEDNGGRQLTSTGYDISKTIYYQGLRIIAVNPKFIPYGSIVEINVNGSVQRAIAIDTGGAMRKRDDLIDLLVDGNKSASDFGRKKGTVTFIRKGWG